MPLNESKGSETAAYWVPIEDLVPWESNPRENDEAVGPVAESIRRFGFASPIIARNEDKTIIAGHTRLAAARQLGLEKVPVRFMDLDPADAKLLALADNKVAEIAEWDDDLLSKVLLELDAEGMLTDMTDLGFSQDELDRLLGIEEDEEIEIEDDKKLSLADRFGLVPFSVFDSRRGWWKNRKDQWLAFGIRSEIGRDDDDEGFGQVLKLSAYVPDYYKQLEATKKRLGRDVSFEEFDNEHLVVSGKSGLSGSGVSVFDPVLCELAYRWFCPPGGTIIDPFAGGSVRGIVAGKLGRPYVGVELRTAQVEANRVQADDIIGGDLVDGSQEDPESVVDVNLGVKTIDPVMPVWIDGDSRNIVKLAGDVSADLIFSCPPYADLEVYSNDPKDISTLKYEEFREAYETIIAETCTLLKDDSFAIFVVGEARGKTGAYYNFVGDTINAFRKAGLDYYNECIFITPAGSLPIRMNRQFNAGRKVGKLHQNVLVFVKGNWREATRRLGPVESWTDAEAEALADPYADNTNER